MGPSTGPRILIVRVGAMGDVLHALPAVAMLRAQMPQAFVGWAVEPRWASLLQTEAAAVAGSTAMPLVNCVHPVEARLWSKEPMSRATARSVLALRQVLRKQRYAIAIDLQGSLRSAVIARLSGASIVGSARPREWPARWLYSTRVVTERPHVIEQAAEIVRGALKLIAPEREDGLSAGEVAGFQRGDLLPEDAAAESWCDALLRDGTGPVVFVAATAGWGAKQWPADRYAAVAAELAQRGYRVMVNASPPLPDATADLVVRAARDRLTGVKFSGESDARERVRAVASTLPQMTALLRRTALVVAGDTGPLHLAAALGRPAVALFGPTDPARNGPFPVPNGTVARVLRDAGSVTDHRRHAETETGLQRIGVEAVLAAAMELLGTA